jgi:hypothetical protein
MAKRSGIWACGIALGLLGVGAAAGSGCTNTEFINEGIPADEMPANMADARCAAVELCFTGEDLTSRDQCAKRTTPEWEEGWGPAVQAGIDDQRIQYFALQAQDCLDAVGKCGGDQQIPNICFATYTGQVEVGGDCQHSLDCKGSAYCHSAAICPGTCTAWGGTDAACVEDTDCERNFRCIDDKCAATGAEGTPCDEGDDCNYDLICLSVGGEGKCSDANDYLTAADGAACGVFAGGEDGIPAEPFCLPELVCTQDTPESTTGTCAEHVAAGEACKNAILNQCPQGYTCAESGMCEAMPTSGACATLYFEPICAPNYACDAGQCTALRDDGTDCTSDEQCASEVCSAAGKCGPQFVCAPVIVE